MTQSVFESIDYVLGDHLISRCEDGDLRRVLILNAAPAPHFLPRLAAAISGDLDCVQWFAPKYDALSAMPGSLPPSVRLHDSCEAVREGGNYDLVICAGTKQKQETRHLIALASRLLTDGSLFVIAAANNAGGKQLDKDCKACGYVTEAYSKHKNRVLLMEKRAGSLDTDLLEQWYMDGQVSYCDKTGDDKRGSDKTGGKEAGFWTCPGLYGWNKIDRGSAFFIETLRAQGVTLRGTGADFGCGYGYLSRAILNDFETIDRLYAIDADRRAVDVIGRNVDDARLRAAWADLTKPCDAIARPLDFIVMNPPFHDDKATAIDAGQAFITQAAACLKGKGRLYMVANTHLPYERLLAAAFTSVTALDTAHGFKVICAVK